MRYALIFTDETGVTQNVFKNDRTYASKWYANKIATAFELHSDHDISILGVPEETTDTDRLEWMIKNNNTVESHACYFAHKRGFYIKHGKGVYKTPREAIDAAMTEIKS